MTACLVVGAVVKCLLLTPLAPAQAALVVARLPDRAPKVAVTTWGPQIAVAGYTRPVPYEPTDPSPGRVYLPVWMPDPRLPIQGVVILNQK